jgi:hypothetical protein
MDSEDINMKDSVVLDFGDLIRIQIISYLEKELFSVD